MLVRFSCPQLRAREPRLIPRSDTSTTVLLAFPPGTRRAFVVLGATGRAVPEEQRIVEVMEERERVRRECVRCQSMDTICTLSTLDHESWYCYACRRGFEIMMYAELPRAQRRRATDRRRKVNR